MSRFDKRNYNAVPGNLILGDGAGGHPAIVFSDVEFCVAAFLCSKWARLKNGRPDDARDAFEKGSGPNLPPPLEFCSWRSKDHRRFFDQCRIAYERIANENSYRADDEEVWIDLETGKELRNPPGTSFEHWLCLNIGEFAYAALPGLTPRIQQWRDVGGPILSAEFMGVMLPPPGYPESGGHVENAEQIWELGGILRFNVTDPDPSYHKNPDWD